MKVLQVGKFYPIRGGVEKVMWDITQGLSQAGIPCDMLCAKLKKDGPDQKDEPFYEGNGILRLNENGRVICVPAWTQKAATMISPAMVRWLRCHAREYDIIHIHHPDPMAALSLRLSGYKGKVVLHWHSDIVSQRFFLGLYEPLQRWVIGRADKILGTTPVYVASSPYLKKVQEKCSYVPIGIDPIHFDADKAATIREAYPGKTLLFSLGRLVPYKGFSYLLDAMQLLPERFHLILGGKGPLQEALENRIREKNLQHRVSLHSGFIPDEEVYALFGAADIFVLPSVMKTEAFGIVQIESMSCGTPVVATRIPGSGVSWVNEEGVSGLNAEPADARSMADAILAVEAQKESYAEGATRRFRQSFSKEIMINKIITAYEDLC
jgi:rhamnosyl/mannosyltransferase